MKSSLIYIKKPELFKELDAWKSQHWVVADIKIKSHLPQWLQDSAQVYWIHHPEEEKSLETFEKVTKFFLDRGISRSATLIAIGGGATTDLAGFVASSILRGINWIAVPTTLLAMVDASLGGKVGVNMPQGKNLVGAFHLPQKILICEEFLSTLPLEEMNSGKGEILKYAFLSSRVYDLLNKQNSFEQVLFECAKFKEELVEKDFKEQGERVYLNLGHTLGHAFESQLKIPHGLAVAMGIKYILTLFNEIQLIEEWKKVASILKLPLEELSLENYSSYNQVKFVDYLKQDKKKSNSQITLVLIERVGQAKTLKMELVDFINKIEKHEVFKH